MTLNVRGWVLSTLLGIAATLPLFAEPWTIAQLRTELDKYRSSHQTDKAVAEKLAIIELSEQLTRRTQDELAQQFHPGPDTAAVLDFLVAQSALLEPPPDEIVQQAAPDDAARSAMFRAAAQFAAVSLRHMPDFIATRSTQAFSDAPPRRNPVTGYLPQFVHLHPDGAFEENITYREGHEVGLDETAKLSMNTAGHGAPGFSSRGEFGPMLRLILSEAFQSRLQWLRWQAMPRATAAVFHYQVPEAESKFRLSFCCISSSSGSHLSFGGTPAYEGEIYLDPHSGDVLRITVRTLLDKSNRIKRAGLAIDYGPVEIAGKTYICPIRSVADATARIATIEGDRMIRHINRVEFVHYRRFGSESRIIIDAPQ